MPKHPPPKTLKNLAFENIIKHMEYGFSVDFTICQRLG